MFVTHSHLWHKKLCRPSPLIVPTKVQKILQRHNVQMQIFPNLSQSFSFSYDSVHLHPATFR